MNYCFNPDCKQPQNPDANEFCQGCGFPLVLQARFRAIALIAQGGMGRTFLALDALQSSPTPCAIKQFLPQTRDKEAIAKSTQLFQQEALRLKQLGPHPQIPTILSYFEENQNLYLVQNYIEGTNLSQLVEAEGTFSETQIWQLLDDLLPVLKFIHDRQIIHRDIKPANIIRRRQDGKPVLVDFGAAKLQAPFDTLRAETSVGSPEYVAPEQVKGKAVLASDLYSLGVTCIYLLTGISPFDLFDVATDSWVWRDYLSDRDRVSDRLAQILAKLLENSLSRRFQSVDEVLQTMQTGRQQRSEEQIALSLPKLWHCYYTITELSAAVGAIAISPDGKILASGGDDKMIKLWELKTGQLKGTLTGHDRFVKSVAFSPDGKFLASGSDDKTVLLWEVATAEKICRFSGHSHAVKSVAFSPKGIGGISELPLLASGSWDKTIKLWDVHTKKEIFTLSGHGLQVSAIAFSPDGQFLASASFDRTARLWYYISPDHPLRHTFAGHLWPVLAIAFSSDGKMVATGSDDNTIKLWDCQTGQLVRTISGHSWSVVSLAFAPDGETLIAGSWDKTLKLWQISTGEEIETLTGHSDSISAIALAANGQIMASSSKDKTIKLWQRSPYPL